jgi:hypothetical protein
MGIEKKSNRRDKIFSLDNTEYMLEKRNVHGGYKRNTKNKRQTVSVSYKTCPIE